MHNLYLRKNVGFSFTVSVTDDLDQPLDISGDVFTSEIQSDPAITFNIENTGTGVKVSLNPPDFEEVPQGRYIYSIYRESGSQTFEFLSGTVIIG